MTFLGGDFLKLRVDIFHFFKKPGYFWGGLNYGWRLFKIEVGHVPTLITI